MDMNKNNLSGGTIRDLCKFGPGGDYTSAWPIDESNLPSVGGNSLSKALATIAEVIGTTIHPELLLPIYFTASHASIAVLVFKNMVDCRPNHIKLPTKSK